ncbi:hypothetical protein EON62_03455 [archaeon]|nr:MAG: hypothetical protein EON62_03455 [archaeon]
MPIPRACRNDIDYMDQHLDFTTDPVAYPTAAFGSFVRMMQQQYDMHYVPIFDPAISSTQSAGTYPAWDDGVQQDVFIKSANGSILIGQVWPGYTAFPDFFSANAQSWWTAQIQSFHNQLPFDGMWIDMNEPSNFCNGECATSASAPGLTGRALLDSVTKVWCTAQDARTRASSSCARVRSLHVHAALHTTVRVCSACRMRPLPRRALRLRPRRLLRPPLTRWVSSSQRCAQVRPPPQRAAAPTLRSHPHSRSSLTPPRGAFDLSNGRACRREPRRPHVPALPAWSPGWRHAAGGEDGVHERLAVRGHALQPAQHVRLE